MAVRYRRAFLFPRPPLRGLRAADIALHLGLEKQGWACPSEECPVRLHDKCAHGFLNPSKGVCIGDRDDENTPDCKTRWDRDNQGNYVGIKVGLGDSNDSFDIIKEVEGGLDDEDELVDSQEPSQKKKKAAPAKGKGKAAAATGKKGKKVARDDDDEKIEDEQEEEEEEEDDDDEDIDGLRDALTQGQGGAAPERNSRAKPKQEVDSDDDMDDE